MFEVHSKRFCFVQICVLNLLFVLGGATDFTFRKWQNSTDSGEWMELL